MLAYLHSRTASGSLHVPETHVTSYMSFCHASQDDHLTSWTAQKFVFTMCSSTLYRQPKMYYWIETNLCYSNRQSSIYHWTVSGCAVNVGSTLVAIVSVDKFGRRNLFLYSGAFMIACQIICGATLGHYFSDGSSKLPDNVSNGVLAVICVYVANFAWSWWASPTEYA